MTPEQAAAARRVHDVLAELRSVVGPAGIGADDERVTDGECFLSEWVIVANWVDAADGESYLTRFGSENLLQHHRVGLLHEGLYGFDDD